MSRPLTLLSIFLAACADPAIPILGADLDPADPEETVAAEGAAELRFAEPGLWCYAFTGAETSGMLTRIEVDLRSGAVAIADRSVAPDLTATFHTAGATWNGAFFSMIGYDGNDFVWTTYGPNRPVRTHGGSRAGNGVAYAHGSYFVPQATSPLTADVYDSLREVTVSRPSGTIPFSWSTRIAFSEEEFYGAWHSTGFVEVTDIDGNAIRTVQLEGYDDWVWGLAVVDGHLAVLNADQVHVFDAETGDAEQTIAIPSALSGGWIGATGLACANRRI